MRSGQRKALTLATVLLAALSAGCSTISLRDPDSRRQFAEAVIGNWSGYSRLQAAKLMQEYGPPDRVKHAELVWNDKGVWRKIRVWDVTPYFDSDVGAPNLEQTISYSIPPKLRRQLGSFAGELRVSSDGAELSARGVSEEEILLTLNLSDDIIQGRRTPDDANRFYDTALQLAMAAKSSPYMQRLLFSPPQH
jgi:hypothetical protein